LPLEGRSEEMPKHVGPLGRNETECARKTQFPTYSAAQHNAERLNHKTGDVVHVYKCACCGKWHVGGFNTANRKKRLFYKRPTEPERTVDGELAYYDLDIGTRIC